ncbi:thioesterase II family protein [Streptomyces celluloflavus]|uniref:thioesterase II family protein n=1 Tax=Streptomyces celluloflavus TaxID=58344 RepID=UPI0037A66458
MAIKKPGRWPFLPLPAGDGPVLLCLPYSGVGASSYRNWPRDLDGTLIRALQPPGRENRFREPRPATHREFSESLTGFLTELGDRPYGFFAHCGAVPYALDTAFHLQDRGRPLPRRIIASSWGPPDEGLYGPLNFVDLDRHDFVAEVRSMARKMGGEIPPEMAAMGAEILRHDQVVQRRYVYPAGRTVPVPVTVVGWSDDEIVPPGQVLHGWDRVAESDYRTLTGTHFAFLDCPPGLRSLLATALTPAG